MKTALMWVLFLCVIAFTNSLYVVAAQSINVSSEQELRDVISNMQSGDDVTINLSSDFDFEGEPVIIDSEKSITIAGRKTITGINPDDRSSLCAFKVQKGATLNLKDATLNNIWVNVSGTFNMSGGEICNVKEYDYRNYSDVIHAVLVTGDGAVFNLDGGSIHSNEVGYGTVYVTDKARMYMRDGEIRDNTSYGSGGGVYVYGDDGDNKVEFILSGGSITDNTAYTGNGGGVCLSSEEEEGAEPHIRFEMTGGTVSGNVADLEDFINSSGRKVTRGGYGGGIYCNTSGATISGGQILDNDADVYGGGIYLGIGSTLNITNAIITKNSAFTHVTDLDVVYWSGVYSIHCASPAGGGFWACPTGDEDFNVNDTLAIFDNECDNYKHRGDLPSAVISRTTKGIGDDFTAMPAFEGFNMTIADRTFDGYPINWYHDGGNLEAVESLKGLRYDDEADYNQMYNGTPNHWAFSAQSPDSERFAEKESPEPVSKLKNINEAIALKSQLTEDAKAAILARKESGVYIAGNSAGAGGGIGSNGKVIAGNSSKKEQNINVEKTWHENVPDEDKGEVTIELRKDDALIDTIKLNKANNWKGKFEGLPDLEYEVIEILPSGFKNRKKVVFDDSGKTIEETVTFENRKPVDKPEIEKKLEGLEEYKVTTIDDEYTYLIRTMVPDDKSSFIIEDTLPEVLYFTGIEDVKVRIDGETSDLSPIIKGRVLTLELEGDILKEYEGYTIELEFTARINRDADFTSYKKGKLYCVSNIAKYVIDHDFELSSDSAVLGIYEDAIPKNDIINNKDKAKARAKTRGADTGDAEDILMFVTLFIMSLLGTYVLIRARKQ